MGGGVSGGWTVGVAQAARKNTSANATKAVPLPMGEGLSALERSDRPCAKG